MTTRMKGKSKSKIDPESLPTYCDFHCPYADFGNPDASGACRTDIAVYCRLFEQYNNKNARCLGKVALSRK